MSSINWMISSDVGTVKLPSMFPSTVKVGKATIGLNADGTWTGDRDAFIAALKECVQVQDGVSMPMLWLIAHAISGDK